MKSSKCAYTVRRKGTFVARLSDPNQCGKSHQQAFEFQCRIVARELDERGFVIDNTLVQESVDAFAAAREVGSCEQLCCGIVSVLHELLAGRALAIQCRIRPNELASVTLCWRLGQPLPSHHQSLGLTEVIEHSRLALAT